MAITCCVCGKRQNGWISDYPLSTQMDGYRLCASCYDKLEKIDQASLPEDVVNEVEFFQEMISKDDAFTDVRLYIKQIINALNNPSENIRASDLIRANIENEHKLLIENFLMTTGYNFEHCKIERYIKVISAETVLGTGFLSEFSAGFSDFFGVESTRFANKLEQARNSSTIKLIEKAIDLEANALIGIDFDYTMFGSNIIAVIINGTAVTVKENYS